MIDMYSKDVLITGSSGFIGSNLLRYNKNLNFYCLTKKNIDENFVLFNKENIEIERLKDKEFVLLHLATFFSKKNNENDLVKGGNIEYGKKVIEKTGNLNINKIIFTNSMYKFYKEDRIKKLEYTKSKNLLNEYFQNFCRDSGVHYEEILLDNTYGINDKRKKVLPEIVSAVLNNKGNPVKNKNANINLVHIEDVISRLKIALSENTSDKSAFISDKSVNVNSIFLFLDSKIKKNNSVNLEYTENNYENKNFRIDRKGLNLKSLENGLESLLKL
ncbi:MAG: NAD-dependent epimerase/dehydratase family protein [Gammaproteobacteria bacterium]|tara:strand:+ start:1436 stop:2257 length:822 start_codon:yes stop_codon:yes gene_type:complete